MPTSGIMVKEWPLMARKIFMASNADYQTAASGLTNKAAPTSLSFTSAMLCIFNNADINGGENHAFVMDRLRLTCTTINTNSTAYSLAFYLDRGDSYSSGGTALSKYSRFREDNTDGAATNVTSEATVYAGNVTVTALSSSGIPLGQVLINNGPFSVDDVVEITFTGEPSKSAKLIGMEPIVIGAGWSLTVHEISPGQTTGPTWIVEPSWTELRHPISS